MLLLVGVRLDVQRGARQPCCGEEGVMGRLKQVRAKHEIGITGRGRLGLVSWTQIKSSPGLRSMFDGDSPFKRGEWVSG